MDSIKGLLELAKNYAYELLALVLPGAILVAAAGDAFDMQPLGNSIGFLVAGYATGVALQGAASAVVHKLWKSAAQPDIAVEKLVAAELAGDLGAEAPMSCALDFCLSRLGADRTVYDKFIALRDTARGLAIAAPVSAGLFIWGHWSFLWTGSRLTGLVRLGLVLLAASLVSLATFSRYRRFAPLAKNAVFGQYLALRAVEKRAQAKEEQK